MILAVLLITVVVIYLSLKGYENKKGEKFKYESAVYLAIVLIFFVYFGGFRPTPGMASKANSFISSDAELLNVDGKNDIYLHTYYVEEKNRYLTTMTTKVGPSYRSNVSTYYNIEEDQPIDMRAFWIFDNDDHEYYCYLYMKRIDANIEVIQVQGDENQILEFNNQNEIKTIIKLFNKGNYPELYACDQEGKKLYYYGYEIVNNTTYDKQWYEVKDEQE